MIRNQCTSGLRRAATMTIALCSLAGAACTSLTPTARPTADTAALEQRASTAEAAGNLAAAADIYTQLAQQTSGSNRASYLFEAARLAADYGDTTLARRRIAEVRSGNTAAQQQLTAVLLARLELLEGRPQAALDALDALAAIAGPLSERAQIDASAVRGQTLFQLGRHEEAVRALVEREVWLGEGSAILANQQLIWDGLQRYPVVATVASGDPLIDGWLALAPLARMNGGELRRALLTWRQTYRTHPAAGGLLAELLAAERTAVFPTQIALLLPLGSTQRAAALALRDGFMAAHFRDSANNATTIRVYDSTAQGGADAYLRAQLDGADFIVGPLLPDEVEQVAAQAGFVPTLALNFTTTATTVTSNFFQFALSSDDEARAIAAAAAAAGARTAIAFVPSNRRGSQVRDNFQAAFEAAGGELLTWSSYEPALQDFSAPIAALLNVTRSRERHRRLAANLGIAVQFPEPRLREDVDMIFVVADARAGRLLAPQLKFFGAGNIPTYATSDIFDPAATARDGDLNGFMFADLPALVSPDADSTAARADLQRFWPQRAGLVRLHSMGFDAYRLVGALYNDAAAAWPLRGWSGDLSLDAEGRVRRVLPLARLQNGRPIAIETVGLAPAAGESGGAP